MHTGEIIYEERRRNISNWQNGELGIMVTTSVLDRGIHGKNVLGIVNYEIPTANDASKPDMTAYLHRTGRCSKFG